MFWASEHSLWTQQFFPFHFLTSNPVRLWPLQIDSIFFFWFLTPKPMTIPDELRKTLLRFVSITQDYESSCAIFVYYILCSHRWLSPPLSEALIFHTQINHDTEEISFLNAGKSNIENITNWDKQNQLRKNL